MIIETLGSRRVNVKLVKFGEKAENEVTYVKKQPVSQHFMLYQNGKE